MVNETKKFKRDPTKNNRAIHWIDQEQNQTQRTRREKFDGQETDDV